MLHMKSQIQKFEINCLSNSFLEAKIVKKVYVGTNRVGLFWKILLGKGDCFFWGGSGVETVDGV